jgi:DNA primase
MERPTTLPHDLDALRRDHPIAEVVTGYGIVLRLSGRALVGRCPFHADGGRPNLYVYPDTASWYCYRCAIGGDAIEFVRRRDNVGLAEACARLASRTRSGGTSSHPPQTEQAWRWQRMTLDEQVVLSVACALYQRALWREPRALDYLRERGISDWVIRAGGLGYADGHSLEAYLRRRSGLSTAQYLGLLSKAERGDDARPLREYLAGRIVVPELRGGQTIWFIGRAFGGRHGPKYLALRGDRPVLGYERVVGQRDVFLCEGVFDYLTAISWGLAACSSCGTSLPSGRLGFLARARAVYGVFDADAGGRQAAERFAGLLGDRFRPIRLPEGRDLNDLARQPDGRATFFRLVADARQSGTQEASHGA